MPKQILVANKSRKQKVKVNFRQSLLGSRACSFVRKVRELPKTSDMGQSVVRQKPKEFHRSVNCMTFPGKLLQFTYSSDYKSSRTKTKENKY